MKNKIYFSVLFLSLYLLGAIVLTPLAVYATSETDELKYYMGTVVNAGHDTGFSKNDKITESDPHFGWTLGEFYVDGYTRVTKDENGDPVFLKTVGDTVTLWFELEQDIDTLNGNEVLSIFSDTNGYDEYFGVEKTEMGRGTLIIRHTDYRNHVDDPVVYTDYLAAAAIQDAAIEVKLCEEGDYEVALDYEIRKEELDIFGWDPFPSYHNYRIFFRFSVRNGNCMVYPFDVVTGAELTNSAMTENGFYLDLAKSRYLNIDIKKEVRKEGAEGLTEDVRFNKPAKDGEQYTDEGIYTITVSNIYTEQTTTKVIYVGTDDVLKAYVATGLPIEDIEYQLSMGATIAEDGTIIPAPTPTPVATPIEVPDAIEMPETENNHPSDASEKKELWPFIIGGVTLTMVLVTIAMVLRKKASVKERADSDENGGGEE